MQRLELVPCKRHGHISCWTQIDGTHRPLDCCTCHLDEGWSCPIDSHALAWLQKHPDFGDVHPRWKQQRQPKPKRLTCGHPSAAHLAERDGVVYRLCNKCRGEFYRTQQQRIV